jgi:hypothetical protein
VIFIIKAKTMDKFNLQGYLKNNQLLNESIGGYVDMKPMKEEIGTAFGEEDSDFNQTADDRMAGLINQEDIIMFKAAVQDIVYDLYEEGFDIEDIQAYLIKLLKTY